jgi:putative transposase
MKANVRTWTVQEMARSLGISRSGYYDYCRRKPSVKQQENEKLLILIRQLFLQARETYGSPRIHAELQEKGSSCSRPRVARSMRKAGLKAKMPRLFKATTRQDERAIAAPNLLQQEFSATVPNEKWVSDITFIRTMEGWLYLAVILDLFSRKVVGMAMGDSLQTGLVLDALNQALQRRQPKNDLQHHSDRGCQYTSQAFQQLLKEHNIVCSMSATGYCFDNAVAESFFHTLKTECVYHERYENREQAKQNIFEYVEVFYNNQRRHSTLGYLSPAEFERRYFQQHLCS